MPPALEPMPDQLHQPDLLASLEAGLAAAVNRKLLERGWSGWSSTKPRGTMCDVTHKYVDADNHNRYNTRMRNEHRKLELSIDAAQSRIECAMIEHATSHAIDVTRVDAYDATLHAYAFACDMIVRSRSRHDIARALRALRVGKNA